MEKLAIVILLVLAPMLIGILLYNSKREFGVYSISKVVKYKKPLALKHYFWLVPVLLVWAAGVFTLLKPLDAAIKKSLFSWVPESFIMTGDFSSLGKNELLIFFFLTIIVIGILIPIIEEMYFRGFVLPKMEWLGWAAPVLNALLFSLYHFWTPWQMVTRFIAILPFCYITYKIKNIKVAILVHCLLNILGDSIAILILYVGL